LISCFRVSGFFGSWIPAFAGMTYRRTGNKCDESAVFADPMGVPGSTIPWIPAFAGMTYFRTARLCVPSFLRRQESTTHTTEPKNSQPIYPITTAPHASSFLRPGSSTKRLRFVGVERQESITPITQQYNNHPTSQPHAS
jgi:hypothetical protein